MSKNLYQEGGYLAHNPSWHEEDSAWKADHIVNLLKRNQVEPKTLCEIGCGSGQILCELSQRLGDAVDFQGYDISPQALAICKPKEQANIHFQLKNLLETEAFFDVAMAIDVFEHVEDYMGFLRKLKERATFKVFHIPLELSAQTVARISPILIGRASLGHLHYFSKETALATLKDTGYEVVDHFFTGSTIDVTGLSWKARMAKVPRKLMFAVSQDWAARILGGFSLMVLAR